MSTRTGIDPKRHEGLFLELARIRAGRVIVGGVGALGNEVVKNLAMMSVGRLLLVDRDTIEAHNLSRSAFFFFGDVEPAIATRVPKVRFIAEMIRRLNPEVQVDWFHGDIADLGPRIFSGFDVAVSCFDAVLPRYVMSARCAEAGIPMVDAGLYAGVEQSCGGTVQVFHVAQGTHCYACKLAPDERARLRVAVRGDVYGCAALQARARAAGGVPSSIVMASLIGAIQAMETAKVLGARTDVFRPRYGAFARFDLANLASPLIRTLKYDVDPSCDYHDFEERTSLPLDLDSEVHSLHDVWEAAVEATGDPGVRLQLPADYFPLGICTNCKVVHPWQHAAQWILGAEALGDDPDAALPEALLLPCRCSRGLAFKAGPEPTASYGNPSLPRASATLRALRLPWGTAFPLHSTDRYGEDAAVPIRDLARFGAV